MPALTRMKQIAFIALGTLIGLMAVELFSSLWLLHTHQLAWSYKQAYLDALPGAKKWDLPRVNHPYFGYVFHTNEGVNNAGFYGDFDYPYRKAPDEFVVGVFGGSVAASLASEMRFELADEIKRRNPLLKNRKVVVLNFGLSTAKQPQTFFIASYYLHTVDMVLNLDGYNENSMAPPPGYPTEFPADTQLRFLDYASNFYSLLWTKVFAKTLRLMDRVPLAFPPLSSSPTYFLLWSQLNTLLTRQEDALLHAPANTHGMWEENLEEGDRAESIQRMRKLEVWERYTLYEAKLAASQKIKAVFFIQPNQYVPGSKTLTTEELKVAYNGPDEKIAAWYRLLSAKAKELRAKGVDIHDLSDVFKESHETFYQDTCCHLNRAGNHVLAEAIAKEIRLNTGDLR